MPDINGTYNGDQATVLPSNTGALLHFSDQFARLGAQRRAEKAAQQRAQQESDFKFHSYLNGVLNNKELNTRTSGQSFIDDGIEKVRSNAEQLYKGGAGWDKVLGYIDQNGRELRSNARRLTAVNDATVKSVAALMAQHPDADPNKIMAAAIKNVQFTPDGQLVNPSELDPTKVPTIVSDTYQRNPELFYSEEAANKALNNLFGKSNSIKKIEELSDYDENGNRTAPGIMPVNVAPFVTVQKDDKGKVIYDENHKAKIAIEGTESYKLPGSAQPYITPEGQQVKVVPEEMYDILPSATKAKITGKVKDQLSKVVDEQGNPIHDMDSPYADMVKRNMAYNTLLNKAQERYPVTPQKDETFDRKRKIEADKLSKIRTEISQRNSNLSAERLQMQKSKDNEALTDANGKPVESRFDSMVNNADTIDIPIVGKTKYVDVTNMDRDEYNQLAGSKVKTVTDATNNTTTTYDKGIEPYEVNGKKVLIVNEKTGTLEGKDGTITKEAADTRQLKSIPKTKFSIKSTIQKAVKSAMSKIPGIKKGALN